MTNHKQAREWLKSFSGTLGMFYPQDVDSLAVLLTRAQVEARLDEAKWWCHVVNKNKPVDWVALGDERLRTLEQAAGGSAAAKRGDAT